MIAIKGMDMPISTQKCQFFKRDSHFENGTQIVSEMICLVTGKKICDVDNILPLYSCKRCPDCPLIDLPEENKDMSWEELKTTYKNKIDTFYLAGGIERITINGKCLKNFKFYSDGTIADEHFNIISERNEISTICKVIKALIGDER